MRRAFTLIELLVAMVITLIMMGAVVSLFKWMGDSVTGSRATIEMTQRLQSAVNRIQLDLQGATCTMMPPRRPENDEGYLEIIEGPQRDFRVLNPRDQTLMDIGTAAAVSLDAASRFGDCDDILMFTSRSRSEPFVGKLPAGTNGNGESQVAEIVYVLRPSPNSNALNPSYTLYRQAFLVLPAYTVPATATATQIRDDYDLSVHQANGVYVANSLGDLTKRENRFAHNQTNTFPFPVALQNVQGFPEGTSRYGEDVLLTNVLAFDVQVYDPDAPIGQNNGEVVTPRDPGYYVTGTIATVPPAFGAWVDLGYNNFQTTWFNRTPAAKSGLDVAYNSLPVDQRPFTYDTWSLHYENDGVDQDTQYGNDQGTNGLDDNNDGVVDDPEEMETKPPYAKPLRGIRITLRVYEPDSRQVREVNIVQDFLPE